MNQIILIERVNNGLILKVPSEDENVTYVYDFGNETSSDDEKKEYESIQNMLYDIIEQINPNSKHNKFRINIDIEEQHD